MSIEVRRFGVGHRRPDGPPGTVGIEAQVIESRGSGLIAELAFGRQARITPHSNPRTTLFLVIEGGGWVGVGDERTRVAAGEAVVWPPDVLHAAWTDGVPMRAIVVELAEDPKLLAFAEGEGEPSSSPERARPVSRGVGSLAPRPGRRDAGAAEGEPD
ncbi:MAG: cupin domain-containing protein [Candidatus Limnocylindrales bacterium]